MSTLFEAEDTNQVLQDSPEPTTILDQLVGEGKKFKTVEDLAKGKAESDKMIEQLLRQNKELTEDLSKDDHAKKLLEQLEARRDAQTPSANDIGSANTNGETEPLVSEDKLKALVDSVLSQRERVNTVEENLKVASQRLEEMYGTEAATKLKEVSANLSLSPERLKELAGESPTAFLTLFEKPKGPTDTFTNSTINTDALDSKRPDVKDWAYYQNLRRTDPVKYHSVKVQQEIVRNWDKIKPNH